MKNIAMKTRSVFALFCLLGVGAMGVPGSQLAGQSPYGGPMPQLFHASDQCLACHNGLTSPRGGDISIGFNWRSSMMGNSARDPYWMASVRRETLDHPSAVAAIEDKCTICHLPMARTTRVAAGGQGQAFQYFPVLGTVGPLTPLAQDGVSCSVCHQIRNENLGEQESFTGGYVIDLTTPLAGRSARGPFEVDAGRTRVMESASEFRPVQAAHVQSAEFCATCHTLFTHALDPQGNEVGELAEQVPYLEWKHSDFPRESTCQDCHMPVVEGEVSVISVLPNPREQVNQHSFRGGNFLMPRILNKYRADLGVQALPQELEETAQASENNLATKAVSLEIVPTGMVEGRLGLMVVATNLAGHKVPTAYPSRRAWIHLSVRDASGRVIFESGALRSDGSIQGNDNDEDGSRYEPHYTRITDPEQVQIYEPILLDHAGEVTTGLLWGVEYAKDNRLLPRGFDKETASWEVEVLGSARGDEDFIGGGDATQYAVEVGGASPPFQVEATMWYQPIGFRWAHNLETYNTAESEQFLRFYEEVSPATAAVMAQATVQIR